MSADDREALQALEGRLHTLLPALYQTAGQDVQPVSMGSAGLKYDAHGRVAWDEMWATFCDLAMAGGPPHKGTWLSPASAAEVAADPDRHAEVAAEICRGVTLVTDLPATTSPTPGWIRVTCLSDPMASWLMRAIVMENVAARGDGRALDLPAGPRFRLEKEIKNVVTVIAKTCHYWTSHMPLVQRRDVGALFAQLAAEAPLIQPAWTGDDVHTPGPPADAARARVVDAVRGQAGLTVTAGAAPGWVGVEAADVHAAIWMMRALVASNVLARREGTVLYVPVDPAADPTGAVVADAVAWAHRMWMAGAGGATSGARRSERK